MPQYRYRTPALAGPWREAAADAVADALAANQALLGAAGRVEWRDDAHVEVKDDQGGIASFRPERVDGGSDEARAA